MAVDGFSVARPAGFRTGLHDHARGELIWSSAVQVVRTPERVLIAPPEGAIWIAPGRIHRSISPYAGTEHEFYFDAALCEDLPGECCVVRLSAALRDAAEALITGVTPGNEQDTLIARMQAGIRPAPVSALDNPLPEAATELRPILEALERDAADDRSLADWARFMGTSPQRLRRAFHTDTGRGFREWRAQMRMLAAVERLALGAASASIACALGYRSPSIFSAAFRRELGVTPGDFFAALRREAHGTGPDAAPPSRTAATPISTGVTETSDPALEADWTHVTDTTYYPRHAHDAGELLWSPDGVLSVGTADGVWIVPHGQAIWVPADCEHDAQLRGATELYYALIDMAACAPLPERCALLDATPTLQRAIGELAAHAGGVTLGDPRARSLLAAVRLVPAAPLPIPFPSAGKLEPVLAAFRDTPAAEHRLEDWAAYLSMSPRTFARTFQRELGTSFASYRRLLRLRSAAERLALGEDVTRTAEQAGYRSVSMFVAMFQRTLGTTPGRYRAAQ